MPAIYRVENSIMSTNGTYALYEHGRGQGYPNVAVLFMDLIGYSERVQGHLENSDLTKYGELDRVSLELLAIALYEYLTDTHAVNTLLDELIERDVEGSND